MFARSGASDADIFVSELGRGAEWDSRVLIAFPKVKMHEIAGCVGSGQVVQVASGIMGELGVSRGD